MRVNRACIALQFDIVFGVELCMARLSYSFYPKGNATPVPYSWIQYEGHLHGSFCFRIVLALHVCRKEERLTDLQFYSVFGT